ncbi:SRPBCC family protein [Aquihabitans sp. McL0605]|uniref:SRPBCC family protein n=1 Tax=Aquihabitans sp. McL0605 TaxID=3415671 RepID=UPI003CF8CA1D
MASPLHVSRSRTFPIALAEAYERTLAWPLPELFEARYGPIPPITSTDQEGEWGTVGQVRTIHTGDGGSMRERLVRVDPPNVFAYEITELTGPMKGLASLIEGTWAFEEVGTGCRITWSWTIHPKSSASGVALPVFGRLWKAYASRALDHLEDLLLTPAA